MIQLNAVSKSFDPGQPVLDEVSLSIKEGAFVSLLGPSGCGKSTILRIMAQLEHSTSGTVEFGDGLDLYTDISIVFQEPRLLPWRTAVDNVCLPLELAGDQSKEAGLNILELVGLKEAAGKYPNELSGGMRMRVAIARALVTNPKVLLLDEPFAALDEITRERLNDELLSLWQAQGWTVVFVTHNVSEAVFLSEDIVVMLKDPGRIHSREQIRFDGDRTAALRGEEQYVKRVVQMQSLLKDVFTHDAD
jgi:NitT/TauT family transport system ATP-binding protein